MKIKLLGCLLAMTIVVTGCTANDPLPDDFYVTNLILVTGGSFERTDGYWHEYNMPALELNTGGSGATLIEPNASSLGGYRLDAINETLYFTSHVEEDWDGVDDGNFEIAFEVNVDNTGGLVTDTVKFQLEVWHKLPTELTNTVFSLEGNTVVGQSDQHELFEQEIIVGNLRAGEVISFRLNLNTIMSQVDNVIVNYVEFKYPTLTPANER
jgi:hypothetical protein